MQNLAQKSMQRWPGRRPIFATLGILLLLAAMVSPAAADQQIATDWFAGDAVVPAGRTSPVQVDPHDVSVRADGAIGFGYTYRAGGKAFGSLPGSFTYLEHGYIYFTNPADPSTMVGSRFVSGVFTLAPDGSQASVQIADTAPQLYTSGIQTVMTQLGPRAHLQQLGLLGEAGSLTYGYFTFTNNHGTFTGYATPDFLHFAIRITFDS
jgi:hypothetical protein